MRPHPRTRFSLRWWIASSPPWLITSAFAGLVTVLAFVLTALSLVTRTKISDDEYAHGSARYLRTFLATTRAVLGVDAFPRQPGNSWHELFAAIASFTGAVIPALVLGIVAVRLFAADFLVWRSKANLLIAAELGSDATVTGTPEDGVLAVRFYKRMRGVTLRDLSLEVYLEYRAKSSIDGSAILKRDRLEVIDANGIPVGERVWPLVENAIPTTLWIPLHAPLRDGRIGSVQGRELHDDYNYALFVKAQAKVAGMSLEIYDQTRYDIPRDLQIGRPVSVELPIGKPPRTADSERDWPGWDRFDEAIDYGVFVYGSMVAKADIAALLGKPSAVRGVDFIPATLAGWRRNWNVGSDNTASDSVQFFTPGTQERAPVHVLFLNLERADQATAVHGYLVFVRAPHLIALDRRESNYDRVLVTNSVTVDPGGRSRPTVVWTYVAKPDREEKARDAIRRGSARIPREYLDRVRAALAGSPIMLAELEATLQPAPAPVETLDRASDR